MTDQAGQESTGQSASPEVSAATASRPSGQLPFTGADVEGLVEAGTAAIVAGGAMVYWTADRHRTPSAAHGMADPSVDGSLG